MPNPAKSVWYIKCYSSSSLNSSTCNFIRYNCLKMCSWLKRPETIMKIRKKAIILKVTNNCIIYKFFKDFTNHRRKTNRTVGFSCRVFPPTFLKIQGTPMRPSNNLENKTPSDTYWRVQLIHIKVQAEEFFRTTIGLQSRPDVFNESRFLMTFLIILGHQD